jgi:hypothetical protein
MKNRYKILTEDGRLFAARQDVAAELEDERDLELTVEQEKAMIAAGWIGERIEPKEKKGGK